MTSFVSAMRTSSGLFSSVAFFKSAISVSSDTPGKSPFADICKKASGESYRLLSVKLILKLIQPSVSRSLDGNQSPLVFLCRYDNCFTPIWLKKILCFFRLLGPYRHLGRSSSFLDKSSFDIFEFPASMKHEDLLAEMSLLTNNYH